MENKLGLVVVRSSCLSNQSCKNINFTTYGIIVETNISDTYTEKQVATCGTHVRVARFANFSTFPFRLTTADQLIVPPCEFDNRISTKHCVDIRNVTDTADNEEADVLSSYQHRLPDTRADACRITTPGWKPCSPFAKLECTCLYYFAKDKNRGVTIPFADRT